MILSMKLLGLLTLASVADLTSALPLAGTVSPAPDAAASALARLATGLHLKARDPCGGDACHEHQMVSSTTTSTWTMPAPSSTASEGNVVETCLPNFEGALVRVKASNENSTWCIPALPGRLPAPNAKLEALNGSTTSFRIEYTGFADDTYLIKLGGIGNNSLILAASSSGVGLCDLQGINNPSFKIACRSCSEPGQGRSNGTVAAGCTIMDSVTGMYLSGSNGTISLQASSSSSSPSSSPSSSAASDQLFDFVSVEAPVNALHIVEEPEEDIEHVESPCEADGPCAGGSPTKLGHQRCRRGQADCPYDDEA